MEHPQLSKNQVDKLGDRIRSGDYTDDDIRVLDAYRESFRDVHFSVFEAIRDSLRVMVAGRIKLTTSIEAKLKRERARLSQIQDIAGLRVIANDLVEQDRFVASLVDRFTDSTIVDRREKPSHGYRAVHVIVKLDGKLVEIQVRTNLQQLWAGASELAADKIDGRLKYGGGPREYGDFLQEMSDVVAQVEERPEKLIRFRQACRNEIVEKLEESEGNIAGLRSALMEEEELAEELKTKLQAIDDATDPMIVEYANLIEEGLVVVEQLLLKFIQFCDTAKGNES